jgi:hypothetical protein
VILWKASAKAPKSAINEAAGIAPDDNRPIKSTRCTAKITAATLTDCR